MGLKKWEVRGSNPVTGKVVVGSDPRLSLTLNFVTSNAIYGNSSLMFLGENLDIESPQKYTETKRLESSLKFLTKSIARSGVVCTRKMYI